MQPHDHTARNAVNGIIADLFKSIVLWEGFTLSIPFASSDWHIKAMHTIANPTQVATKSRLFFI